MAPTKHSKKNKLKHIPQVKIVPPPAKKGFPIPPEEIENVRHKSTEALLFSFKFLDVNHEAFNLGRTKESWYVSFLDALKETCCINRHELIKQRQHYDAHGHKWHELDYKFNFSDDFLEQVECLQFNITKSTGRVHGFIIGNRFYIVWLDPKHNLYPDESFGGRILYDRQLTCYEKLLIEHEDLKREYSDLECLLDNKTNSQKQ